jgi:tetratricopeptide (TPR) repeat protein
VIRSWLLAAAFGAAGCGATPSSPSPPAPGGVAARGSSGLPAFEDSGSAAALRAQAETWVRQGRYDEAEAALRGHMGEAPGDREARRLLCRLLIVLGRSDEGLAILRDGIGGDAAADYLDWMLVGDVSMDRMRDGPWVERTASHVLYRPSGSAEEERAFMLRHLRAALEAAEAALALRPDSRDALALAAITRQRGGDLPNALVAAERLCTLPEAVPEDCGPLAFLLERADRAEEAVALWQRVLERNPRMRHAHESLARLHASLGRIDEARAEELRLEFYSWIPDFADVEYAKARLETVRILARHFGDGEPLPLDELERAFQALIDDPSPASSGLLAAFVWHHSHDRLEERAFAALDARYPESGELLLALLANAASTCTVRASARILAERRHPGILDLLAALLPDDLNWPYDMDIAGALDALGDPAAVPVLIEVLDPRRAESPPPAARSGLAALVGDLPREFARARAALALGAFDTPAAHDALEACTADPEAAAFCHAALYRLTGDPSRLEPLRDVVGEEGLASHIIRRYLSERVGTEAARAFLLEVAPQADPAE